MGETGWCGHGETGHVLLGASGVNVVAVGGRLEERGQRNRAGRADFGASVAKPFLGGGGGAGAGLLKNSGDDPLVLRQNKKK